MLLTGFEPFAGATANSSWDAVRRVAETWTDPAALVVERLPVTFADAGTAMRRLMTLHSPDIVIATGLANGRAEITPERIAVNVEDARIPDNAGDQPSDRPVSHGAPAAHFSGLPVRRIVDAIAAAGIPSRLSDSAGTYVCNSLMYSLMAAVEGTDIRAGFIHVPASREIAGGGEPFLEIDVIARAVSIAVRETIAAD